MMAGVGAIRAGSAYVEISADSSALLRGLRQASAQLQRFGAGLATIGAGMTAVGGAITAPFVAAATAFANTGDTLAKISDRTGLSVEALSELSYAASISGSNLEELETSLKNMQRMLGAAATGSGAAAERLSGIGLSIERLAGMSPEAQFSAIADAIARIADPTARAAAAVEIFGRNGTKLIPLMQNMQALRTEARGLGMGWTGADAESAVALKDAMTRLLSVARRLVETVGGTLAPVFTGASEAVTGLLAGLRAWVSGSARLVVSLVVVGGVLVAAGAAVTALGLAIKTVGIALGAVASVVAAMLSPWALLAAAVVGLGGYLTATSDAGARAIRRLGAGFDGLYDAVAQVARGIRDALSAGDISLAGQIFWGALQVAWQAGLNTLRGYWLDFKAWFLRITDAMFVGASSIAIEAWAGVARAFVRAMGIMREVSDAFVSGVARAWNDLGTWVAKRWTSVLAVLDTTIDVAATNRRLEQEGQRRNIAIAHTSANITLEGLEKIRALETERRRMLAAVADMADREGRNREEGYDAERKAAEESLAAARESLRMAMEEARLAARAGRLGAAAEYAELAEEARAPALSRATMDVAGAFAGAFELLGLGGTAMDRTAAATEETARNTRKIAQKMDDGALAFG